MSAMLSLQAQIVTSKDAYTGANTEQAEYNFLVEEEDGELLEQRQKASGMEPVVVASELKTGTPAAYLVGNTMRFVFCLDRENVIQSYSIKNDEEEYDPEPGPIGSKGIKAHPLSKLATAWTSQGSAVFFQDDQGHLSSVVAQDPQTWTVNGPFTEAVKPVIGTPLVAMPADLKGENTNLYYLSSDGYIHYLTIGEDSRTDQQVGWANLGATEVKRFVVREASDKSATSVYFYILKSDDSFIGLSQNESEDIGKITREGKLDLTNKQECGFLFGVNTNVNVNVVNVTNKWC